MFRSIIILTLLAVFYLCGCSDSKTQSNKGTKPASKDSTDSVSVQAFYMDESEITSNEYTQFVPKEERQVIVDDESKYSPVFISGLKELNYGLIELKGNLIILDKKDTVKFPEGPPQGKSITYTGRKGDLVIAVFVTRKNLATIEYAIEMVEFGKASHHQKGEACISPGFVLASETDENAWTGESYPVDEYIDDKGECFTHIRLGSDRDGMYTLCSLVKNCNGKIKDIDLSDFPTLQRK